MMTGRIRGATFRNHRSPKKLISQEFGLRRLGAMMLVYTWPG